MGTGAGRAHAAVPTSSSHRPNRSYPDRGRAERAGRPRDSDGPAASPIRHPTARTALPDLSARSAVSSRPGRQSTRRCRATPRTRGNPSPSSGPSVRRPTDGARSGHGSPIPCARAARQRGAPPSCLPVQDLPLFG